MVVSESLELLHVVGDASDNLRFPPGKVINDISKLVNKDLAIPLATGLQKVLRNKQELTYSNIYLNKLQKGKERRTVNLRLKPLSVRQGQAQLIAVFIEEVHSTSCARHARLEVYDVGREAQQRISDLENELQFTRENLQATVEELETFNEELQATNEELLASNEELQSTNEELNLDVETTEKASTRRDLALVRAITSMAKDLGMTIVVEGVETEQQRRVFAKLGCDLMQGWLFSPAVHVVEMTRLFERGWLGNVAMT